MQDTIGNLWPAFVVIIVVLHVVDLTIGYSKQFCRNVFKSFFERGSWHDKTFKYLGFFFVEISSDTNVVLIATSN